MFRCTVLQNAHCCYKDIVGDSNIDFRFPDVKIKSTFRNTVGYRLDMVVGRWGYEYIPASLHTHFYHNHNHTIINIAMKFDTELLQMHFVTNISIYP